MKHTLTVTLALAACLLLAGAVHADNDNSYSRPPYGPGWGPGMMWGGGYGGYGPGMMRGYGGYGGYGPGMMGGGFGPGMMWGGAGDWDDLEGYSQLPKDKRDALRELAVNTQRQAVAQMGAMWDLRLQYGEAIAKFPVDKEAAAKAWDGMNAVMKAMFTLQLESLAKAQQILGKDLWESLQPGWGGAYGPGGRGRGPGRGPGPGPR